MTNGYAVFKVQTYSPKEKQVEEINPFTCLLTCRQKIAPLFYFFEKQGYAIFTSTSLFRPNISVVRFDYHMLAGDVITSVDGMNLDSDAFVERTASCEVGESLTLEVYRQGQALEITLTVGEQIQSQAPQVPTAPAQSEDPELLPRSEKAGTIPSWKAY